MESATLTVLATFLAPYLHKAGEKVAEKTVETLFDSRKDIAEKFRGLFQSEIISLNLKDSISIEEINQQLIKNPQIKEEINRKLLDNQELIEELIKVFNMSQSEFSGVAINAEKIAQINVSPEVVSQTIENF